MLKGISHLADHAEILFKSSWMLCLLRSVITEFLIFVSSANFPIKLFSQMAMSFIYIMNSTALRTGPCGTPLVTGAQSELSCSFDNNPLFSIAEPVLYPVVHITDDSKLFDLEH